jgi:hypothetical protein
MLASIRSEAREGSIFVVTGIARSVRIANFMMAAGYPTVSSRSRIPEYRPNLRIPTQSRVRRAVTLNAVRVHDPRLTDVLRCAGARFALLHRTRMHGRCVAEGELVADATQLAAVLANRWAFASHMAASHVAGWSGD